ncbi:MAG: hypothetical protein KDC87_05810, partial [Planctomycetes bacterium]|nr:hypothetical protein [Planctomycetota bacterium]
PKFVAKDGARVVISVPVEEQEREARQRESNVSDTSEAGDEGITSFKTTGYFNKAEQQIETSMIAKSFQVQDRSKFEAKLRDRRTKPGTTRTSIAKQAEVEAADTKKKNGEITIDEWAKERARIEKKYKSETEEPGTSRGRKQKELFDTSELIRAAQEGDVMADYILQVNTFRTEQLSDRPLYLLDQPEMKKLCESHPGLREALQQTGKNAISQPGFFGLLNAKLIDVQTGVIHWVGEHRVESARVFENGYKVIVPITKRVANEAAVNAAIREHNDRMETLHQACENLRGQAMAAVAALQNAAKAKLQIKPDIARKQRRCNAAAEKYSEACDKLAQAQADGPPAECRAAWQYSYSVGTPSTRPEMPTTDARRNLEAAYKQASGDTRRNLRQLALRYREFLNEHFSQLARLVAKELINTIPSK